MCRSGERSNGLRIPTRESSEQAVKSKRRFATIRIVLVAGSVDSRAPNCAGFVGCHSCVFFGCCLHAEVSIASQSIDEGSTRKPSSAFGGATASGAYPFSACARKGGGTIVGNFSPPCARSRRDRLNSLYSTRDCVFTTGPSADV